MKIAIIGTGGVGGYFGGRLAQAGFDVTFVARGKHLQAIKQNGLKVKSILGDFTIHPTKATADFSELNGIEFFILGVKAWQVKEVSKNLKPFVGKNAMVIPLQNGVLAAKEIAESIHPKNIISGSCRIISKIADPGVIEHQGINPIIYFGELNDQKSDRVNQLKKVFDKAKIQSTIAENMEAELWKKFILICISGLLAITRSSYGEAREMKETRKLLVDLITEIYQISQKAGVKLNADIVDETMKIIDTAPYGLTNSLARDVMEGRPSEIEHQNGTVVRLGEKYGIDTPVNRFIYHCILPMETRNREITGLK